MLSYPIGTPGSNALIGLAEAVFSVADPTASAGWLAKFTGRSAIETETGMRAVSEQIGLRPASLARSLCG